MKRISRRNFLKVAGVGAAALGCLWWCCQLHRVQHGIFCRYFFRSGCGRHHQGCRHRDRLRR